MRRIAEILFLSICLTACSMSGKEDNKRDDVIEAVEEVDTTAVDHFDSLSGKWIGPHSGRLNGTDNSPFDTIR